MGITKSDAPAPKQLDSLAKQLGQGAAIVTALLAFLGITGGQLDRLLRNQAKGALTLFALIGLGIVVGIAVLAFSQVSKTLVLVSLSMLIVAASGLLLALWLQDENRLLAGIFAVVGAVALLVLLVLVASSLDGRALLLLAGVVTFIIGVAGLGYLAVTSKAAKDRPRIEAELIRSDSGWSLQGQVSARGLTSREHISISVEGWSATVPFEDRRAGRQSDPVVAASRIANKPPGDQFYQNLSFMRVGPSSEGEVDIPIKVPVTIGLYDRVRVAARLETEVTELASRQFNDLMDKSNAAQTKLSLGNESSDELRKIDEALDRFYKKHSEFLDDSLCSQETRERSCLNITLPQSALRPTLTVIPGTKAGTVSWHVVVADLNPDDVVDIQIATERGTVHVTRLSVGATGTLDETAIIPVGTRAMRVCATGRILRGAALAAAADQPKPLDATCPAPPRWDVAYVELIMR